MNWKLFWQPLHLAEHLGWRAARRRRRQRLRGTIAADLQLEHLDSLELLDWIQANASPPIGVIYDLGANVGTWTALAKSIMPAAVVHAFEPLARHADEFVRRSHSWPNIQLHRVALGSRTGEAEMDITNFSDAASLLPLAKASHGHFGLQNGARVSVPVVRLDEWKTTHDLPGPDLIKLDLQGYELEALRGAVDTLAATRYVIIEVSFVEFYTGQPLFHEIVAFFAEHGFALTALGQNTPIATRLVQLDALFTRQNAGL